MSAGEMSQIAEELVGQFAHKPPIRIIDRASEVGLPETVDATGFVRDGAIHLVRSGISSRAELVKTFWHEILHYGLRRFLTKEQYTLPCAIFGTTLFSLDAGKGAGV